MAGPTSRRRNPPRRCRGSQMNEHKQPSHILDESDSSKSQDQSEDDNRRVSQSASEHLSESDHSDFEASDHQEDAQDESSSADFEEQDVKILHRKRTQKPRSSAQGKRKRTKQDSVTSKQTSREQSVELSEKQAKLLDDIFSAFDPHQDGRICLSDILRVADDHGCAYEADEVRDMVRFWDTAGTVTVSRDMFTRLAVETKFVNPASK